MVCRVSRPWMRGDVRYTSVTHTAKSVSWLSFVRYFFVTYALLMHFMRSLHVPRRPSSPTRRLSSPDDQRINIFAFRRLLLLSVNMWQHQYTKEKNKNYGWCRASKVYLWKPICDIVFCVMSFWFRRFDYLLLYVEFSVCVQCCTF